MIGAGRRALAAAILGGCLAIAAGGQAQPPPGRIPRIAVLYLTTVTAAASAREMIDARFRDLGYVDGRNVIVEYHSAEGRAERLPELAAALAARKVDVIVTGGGNPATLAARNATRTIPIVMSASVDAVEAGLVESLARPGGNVTGLTVPRELAVKQLELLRELDPSLSRVVILLRRNPAAAERRAQARVTAREFLRLDLEYADVDRPEDVPRALAAARATRPGALLVAPDPVFWQHRDHLIEFARTNRVPVMYPFRDFVDAGGLMSYSVSGAEISRAVVRYVDRILKGAKPGDLPVEQPTTFELVINLKTAKALGLTLPRGLLERADAVIE